MSGGHAPYIMPDGRSLTAVLRAEGPTQGPSSKRKNSTRPKDELWGQLQLNKRSALSDAELAEIRAIERVGLRRRRQWLNDKLLRDLAGPMSTHDMEGQFKPIPFGIPGPPSAFSLAAAPEHAALWDHFRSIDSDQEARVLQAWEDHNRRQQHTHHPSGALVAAQGAAAAGGCAGLQQQQQAAAAAAAALAKWSRVDRRSRAALKKASAQAVLSLELEALQLLQQEDPDAQLLLDLPDGFARLLMHGLAQFHGLQSITCMAGGQKAVLLQCRQGSSSSDPPQPAPSAQQQQQDRSQQQASAGGGETAEPRSGAEGEASGGGVAGAAEQQQQQQDTITCTDVVMALQESSGDSLSHHSLQQYIKSVHGSMGCPGDV